jgi:predicted component of type VI protein secretion system
VVIALRLVRRSDGADPGRAGCAVAAGGSTIGRAPDCDLVLDDPRCLVSRRHAWLVPKGADQALLRCISTTAALLVNGEALTPGSERLVRLGDRLRIGGFEVLLEAGEPAVAAAPQPVQPAPARPRAPRLDQWFELDTVADPLGPGSPLPALDQAALPELTRRVVRKDPVVAARRDATPHEPSLVDRELLRRAFLRGAGLDPATPFMPGPAEMEHLGQLLRAATEGMLGLLHRRAAAEGELRDDGTRVVARENNPLKFVPDAAQALQLLLDMQERRGFLDPVDAVRDVHDEWILESSFGREFLRAYDARTRWSDAPDERGARRSQRR